MKVGMRLALGFGAVATTTVLIGIVSTIALRSTVSQKDEVATDLAEGLSLIERLRYRAEQVVATSRGYLLTGLPEYLAHFEESKAAFDQSVAEMGQRLTASQASDLAQIREAGVNYVSVAERAARRREGAGDLTTVLPYFENVVKPMRDKLEARLDELVRHQRATFTDKFVRSRQAATAATWAILITAFASIGLTAWLGMAVLRRTAAQFEREHVATAAAQRATQARDDMLAVVSHDLSNPLSAIIMGAAAVQRRLPAEAAALGKQVRNISKAAERMQHLIDDLLDMARIDGGGLSLRKETIDVGVLIGDALALFEARAAAVQVVLSKGLPMTPLAATVDRERIIRVLSNLVGNALNFTAPGGEISVRAEAASEAVHITVTDSGAGIPADELPHLFERHWRGLRSKRQGLGLGLYIAKSVVNAHGGQIEARSRVGAGSTFAFTLPRAAITEAAGLLPPAVDTTTGPLTH